MLRHYNLRAVFATLGPYRIGGFGNDGGIEIAPVADYAETAKDADGEDSVVSYSNNLDAVMTITLSERSRSYRDLGAVASAFIKATRAGTPLPVFPFRLDDTISGDKGNVPEVAMTKLPNMDKKKASGDRVFVFLLPNWYESAEFGRAIV